MGRERAWLEPIQRHVQVSVRYGAVRTLEISPWPDDMREDRHAPYANDEGFTPQCFGFWSDPELIAAIARALTSPAARSIEHIALELTRIPMSNRYPVPWLRRMPARLSALVAELRRTRPELPALRTIRLAHSRGSKILPTNSTFRLSS